MENTKKALLVFLIVIIIIAIGGFLFFKKNFVNKTPVTNDSKILNTTTSTNPKIPGYIGDMTNKIPSVFPEGLVIEKDIKVAIESYKVGMSGQKTQYTFRYVSINDLNTNKKFFNNFLKANNWGSVTVTPGTSKTFFSVSALKDKKELLITVNSTVSNGVIVDVTYIE